MELVIEEILGYSSSKDKTSGSITRAYFIQADSPEEAKAAFEDYADSEVEIPDGMELDNVQLDEEKGAVGLYFGKISLKKTNTKHKIADDLEELFGEKKSVTRKAGSHERVFRVKSTTATAALTRLENYIRSTMEVSGRLHIGDISVDENSDGDGWFMGKVVYSNPDHKGARDKFSGITPAYGDRVTLSTKEATAEYAYELRGFGSANAALSALQNQVSSSGLDEITVDEDGGGGEKIYVGRVRYKAEGTDGNDNNNDDDDGDQYQPSVSFEVSGSQTKMTCSLATRGGWAANGASPRNYGGLIGVTDDGVEGVDIDTAVSTFAETVYFYPWFLTSSYIAFLARAYGCVNSSPFRGFATGEVRFLGASGSYKRGERAAEMTFKFAVSPNANNIKVGSMTIPFKYGWDYLWVRWAEVKNGNVTVKIPIEAYVEKVYQGLNFYALGIG